QTILLGGTTPHVANFQAAFDTKGEVGVSPIDSDRRGVPSANGDGLGALTTNEGKL
ncbi:unnamed protein product, partial [Adineta steineri]